MSGEGPETREHSVDAISHSFGPSLNAIGILPKRNCGDGVRFQLLASDRLTSCQEFGCRTKFLLLAAQTYPSPFSSRLETGGTLQAWKALIGLQRDFRRQKSFS